MTLVDDVTIKSIVNISCLFISLLSLYITHYTKSVFQVPNYQADIIKLNLF